MTNGEKFKTAKDRADAFSVFCESQSMCFKCPLVMYHDRNMNECRFAWLELEAEDEKPLTCIWCNSEMQHVKEGSGHFLACVNCNHTTRKFKTKEELVREYNRVAMAVKESEVKV